MILKPQDVAQDLGISPSTLRLWSTKFADLLSDQARKLSSGGIGTTAQRRYTEDDVAMLMKAKELLAQGLTYDEVCRRLGGSPPERVVHQSRPTDYSLSYNGGESAFRLPPQESRMPDPAYGPQGIGYRPQELPLRPDAYIPPPPPARPAYPHREPIEPDERDRSVAGLTQSVSSIDTRMQRLVAEVKDLRAQEKQLRKELDRMRFVVEILVLQRKRPWWKRLLAIPEAPPPDPLPVTRQRRHGGE